MLLAVMVNGAFSISLPRATGVKLNPLVKFEAASAPGSAHSLSRRQHNFPLEENSRNQLCGEENISRYDYSFSAPLYSDCLALADFADSIGPGQFVVPNSYSKQTVTILEHGTCAFKIYCNSITPENEDYRVGTDDIHYEIYVQGKAAKRNGGHVAFQAIVNCGAGLSDGSSINEFLSLIIDHP